MKTGIARIPIAGSFCSCCSSTIKIALLKLENISNVYFYPSDSLIVFNFVRANELSEALNVLTALGYPELGDTTILENYTKPDCRCTITDEPLHLIKYQNINQTESISLRTSA